MSIHRIGRHFLHVDGRSTVPVGAHYVPTSGPDWPWRTDAAEFDRAFAAMAAGGLTSVRIDLLWAAVEPAAGRYDDAHLGALDEILTAAARHGLTLHPTLFVGGEVGDAYWDLPWAPGVNPHTDEDLLARQAAQATMFATRWRDRPELIAWDLTDEPPFWIHQATTGDDESRRWTATLVGALRAADPEHLITIGTASQEVDHGPFRADVTAPDLDFCCVHPYPIYSPELYPDSLLAPRMTHAAAFETALARGAGRSVMVHEYGASSTQFDPERIAAYDRLMTWSSLGRGAVGFYAWCWTDAEPAAYSRAPYVRMPHETQFGITTADGRPRPRLHALTELADALRELDLDAVAADGPRADASLLVPFEYARPYDPAAYGLDAAPAGPYRPAEPAWSPHRDVKPLIRGWLNAFVLAAQAGFAVDFPRERLDGRWPATRLALAPAPLTTTTNSLLHLRTSTWDHVPSFHDTGGTLYLSCSTESAIPDLVGIAGVRIADRAPLTEPLGIRVIAPFGSLAPGDKLVVPHSRGAWDPHLHGVLLDPVDAEVVAVDDAGRPVLTVARRSAGATVACAYPIELLLADRPSSGRRDDLWRIYAAVAELAGVRDPAGTQHPDLTDGVLTGPDGGLLITTNHSGEVVSSAVRLPGGATGITALPLTGAVFDEAAGVLTLQPYSVSALSWQGPTE